MNVDDYAGQERYAPLVARIPSGWGRWIDVGDGWADLVINLDKDISTLDPDYEIHQCKEKFGGLRYYIGHTHNDNCRPQSHKCLVSDLVDKAEIASFSICEVCGQPGTLRGTSWVRTLCDEHAVKYSPYKVDKDQS